MQDPNLPWCTSADDIDRAYSDSDECCGNCTWLTECELMDGGGTVVCTRNVEIAREVDPASWCEGWRDA